MAQRRIEVTHPPKTVAYYKAKDGWRVRLRHGARLIRDDPAGSKEDAMAKARELLAEWPGAVFELCVLGRCFAWETPTGWVYSRERAPGAVPVRVLDEWGVVVLEKSDTGYYEFVTGSRPATAQDAPATRSPESEP